MTDFIVFAGAAAVGIVWADDPYEALWVGRARFPLAGASLSVRAATNCGRAEVARAEREEAFLNTFEAE